MDLQAIVKMFPFLAVLAPLVMFWGTIKGILAKIFNLFVIEVEAKNNAVHALSTYLKDNGKRINMGKFGYKGNKFYLKSLKRNGVVTYKDIGSQNGLYFLGWKPIFVFQKQGRDKTTEAYWDSRIKVYYFRGLFDADTLMKKATDEYNEKYAQFQKRFLIKVICGIGNKNIIQTGDNPGLFRDEVNVEDLLSEVLINCKLTDIGYNVEDKTKIPYVFYEQSEAILRDVEKWKKSQEWYRDKGILWRRGTLLYGKPGTGKTSLIRAIGQTLDMPVYVFDLASLCNSEFISEWQKLQGSTPCLAVFEDIDAVFEKRVNVIGENGGGLSFDCLLNAISGALPSEGVYIFATTNNVEKLDEALGVPDQNGFSSRPGRLDNMAEIGYISKECKMKIAQKILGSNHPAIKKEIDSNENMTAARFVDICTKRALEDYWGQ